MALTQLRHPYAVNGILDRVPSSASVGGASLPRVLNPGLCCAALRRATACTGAVACACYNCEQDIVRCFHEAMPAHVHLELAENEKNAWRCDYAF